MAFYVPLGSRGVILRVGTILIGVLGGFIYRRASRRRGFFTSSSVEPIIFVPES